MRRDVDAGAAHRLGIGADAGDVAAEARLVERPHRRWRGSRRAISAGSGTPRNQARPMSHERARRVDRDRVAAGDQQRDAADHREPGQRDDEGRDALIGDEEALERADQRRPAASMATTTSGQGRPACSSVADSALTSASTEPTERSMPPVVMTKVIAAATISSGADWRRMLSRLGVVRKASVAEREDDADDDEEERRSRRRCRWRAALAARSPCRTLGGLGRQRVDGRSTLMPALRRACRLAAERAANLRPTIRLTTSSILVSPIRRSATLRPSYMTWMRSQTRNRSCRRWVIRMTLTPRGADGADQVQHRLDLGHRKRRGRLVHDQHGRLERGGAADGDRLALAAGQVLDLECACRG